MVMIYFTVGVILGVIFFFYMALKPESKRRQKKRFIESHTPKFSVGDPVYVKEFEWSNEYHSVIESIHCRKNGAGDFFWVYGMKDNHGQYDFIQESEIKVRYNHK